MRRACLTLLAIASGGVARAAEFPYIAAGDAHDVTVLPAPLPERAFGAFAAAIVDGRREGPAAAPVARGRFVAPIAAPEIGDVARERVAVVVLRRTFQVGDELPRLRLLRLRARFQDSLVATVNGVEVARRNLEPAAAPDALAQRTHGAEWESMFVPVEPGLLHPGENVLSVEVRPSAARLAPIVDVELTGSDAAHVVRGPIVQRVTGASATIVFETDLPTAGEVRLPGRILPDLGGASTRHVIDIDGLSPATEVEYQIAAGEEVSGTFRFHTAPGPGEPVRLVVYGDVRGGHDVHAEIAQAVEGEAPDFVIRRATW